MENIFPRPNIPLLLLNRKNIAIPGVKNSQRANIEELTAGGSELDVASLVMLHVALGEHAVVLEGALAEGGAVRGYEDQTSAGGTKSFKGALVTKGRLPGLHHQL